MSIAITCPICQTDMQAPAHSEGKRVICNNCGSTLQVPPPDEAPKKKTTTRPEAPDTAPDFFTGSREVELNLEVPGDQRDVGQIQLGCPECHNAFPVRGAVGMELDCPYCGHRLKIPDQPSTPSAGDTQRPTHYPLPPYPQQEFPTPASPRRSRGKNNVRPQAHKNSLAILVTVLVLLFVGGAVGALAWFHFNNLSALRPYETLVPGDTVTVFHANLAELRKNPTFRTDLDALDNALRNEFQDMKLEPASAPVTSLVIFGTKSGQKLSVFSFDQPVELGKLNGGRYHQVKQGEQALVQDRYNETNCWALDGQGRLLHGSQDLVDSALKRERALQRTQSFDNLEGFVRGIPSSALAWGAIDFGHYPATAKSGRLQGLQLQIIGEDNQGARILAKTFFPSAAEGETFLKDSWEVQKVLDQLGDSNPANLPWKAVSATVREKRFESPGQEIVFHKVYSLADLQANMKTATGAFAQIRNDSKQRMGEVLAKMMEKGDAALKDKEYEKAAEAFKQAQDIDPTDKNAQQKHDKAQAGINAEKTLQKLIAEGEEAIGKENVPLAKSFLEKIRNLPNYDSAHPKVADLGKKIGNLEKDIGFKQHVKNANEAVANLNLPEALKALDLALGIRPDDAASLKLKTALVNAQQAGAYLKEGKNALVANDSKSAMAGADKAWEALQAIPADPLLTTLLDKLGGEARVLYRYLFDQAWAAAGDHREQGIKYQDAKKFAEGKEEFAQASAELDKAKEYFERIKKIAPMSDPELDKKGAEIPDKAKALAELSGQSESLAHRQNGLERLKEGKKLLAKEDLDSLDIKSAQGKLRQAKDELNLAKGGLGNKVQKDIDEAESKLKEIDGMLQPIHYETSKNQLPPEDWLYVKNKWGLVEYQKGKYWLEPKSKVTDETFSMDLPKGYFPRDFDLRVTVGAVDNDGQLRNRWDYYPQLVKVVLWGKKNAKVLNETFVVTLGQDPNNKIKREAGLWDGYKYRGAQFLIEKRNPVTIHMVRARQAITITLIQGGSEQQMAAFPLPQQFQAITIQFKNGGDVFPVFFGASLKMLE